MKDKLVSIGMPVYNEERFIRQSLDSLLGQKYENFELIISDNASTDSTPAICREYAERDKRIKYFCNQKNLGQAKNFNRVFNFSSGEYFMWASPHDLWDKVFISRCVGVLDVDKEVVLAFSSTVYIDTDGEKIGFAPEYQLDTSSIFDPAKRFRRILREYKQGNIIEGLMRRNQLGQTHLFLDTIGPELVLLAQLSLAGRFIRIDAPLFYRRRNRPDETSEQRRERWLETIAPNMNKNFPYSILMWNHFIAVKKAPLAFLKKAGLAIDVFRFFYKSLGFEVLSFLHILPLYRCFKNRGANTKS